MGPNLIVFGDSWPAGAELDNPKVDSFPALISKLLGITVRNFSIPGTSQDQAILQFLREYQQSPGSFKNCKILFCFTGLSRGIAFKGDDDREVHPSDPAYEFYYTRIYSDELGKFNFLKNLLLIQNICKVLKIPLYCVSNWDAIPDHLLIDQAQIYQKTLTEIVGLGRPNSEVVWEMSKNSIYMATCHPNILGHKKIAEELAQWINFQ